MNITRADIVAAREAASTIPKEAQIFGDPQETQRRDTAKTDLENMKSPDYWYKAFTDKYGNLDGPELEAAKKQFVEQHAKNLVDSQADVYKDAAQGAAEGGMLNRYNMASGGLGAAVGAIIGGVFGGGKGALIGGLLGGIALYAVQKLGIGGEVFDNFIKSGTDTLLGPTADPVDKEKLMGTVKQGVNAAADTITGTTGATMGEEIAAQSPAAPPANWWEEPTSEPLPADAVARTPAPAPGPVAPATTAPVAPATTAPVAPATTAPVAPATTGPVAPATTAPVAPATTAPVAPAAPAAPAPVAPATPAAPTEEEVALAQTAESAQSGEAKALAEAQAAEQQAAAVQARRQQARESLAASQSVPGKIRGAIATPATHAREYAKVPGQIAGAAVSNMAGTGEELAGLTGDVAGAVGSNVQSNISGGKAIAEEAAGLAGDWAGAAGSQAEALKKQTTGWLGDRAKDIKTILSGFKGN